MMHLNKVKPASNLRPRSSHPFSTHVLCSAKYADNRTLLTELKTLNVKQVCLATCPSRLKLATGESAQRHSRHLDMISNLHGSLLTPTLREIHQDEFIKENAAVYAVDESYRVMQNRVARHLFFRPWSFSKYYANAKGRINGGNSSNSEKQTPLPLGLAKILVDDRGKYIASKVRGLEKGTKSVSNAENTSTTSTPTLAVVLPTEELTASVKKHLEETATGHDKDPSRPLPMWSLMFAFSYIVLPGILGVMFCFNCVCLMVGLVKMGVVESWKVLSTSGGDSSGGESGE